MRILVAVLLMTLLACAGVSAEDAEKDDFADWFGMMEVQTGGLFNFATEDWKPFVAMPTLGYRAVRLVAGAEIDTENGDGPVAGVLGVTYNMGSLRNMGIDVPWMEHFGVNVGPYMRYDFDTGDIGWGAMVSIVDLSFGNGNVERQKER
jgi:hypothetical protein